MKKIRILSCDPGSVNFAWSVIEMRFKFKRIQYRIIKTRMLENPINEIKGDFRENAQKFVDEIKWILGTYGKIDFFCAERFQSRTIKTVTIEKINLMLGIISTMLDKDTGIRLITASGWKNEYNRQNAKSIKKICKNTKKTGVKFSIKDLYNKVRTPAHVLDAVLIGIYSGYIELEAKPFIYQTKVRHVYTLFDKIESDYPSLRKIRFNRES